MKLADKLREKLAQVGATLDMTEYDLNADAPSGYTWAANGCRTICAPWASNSQTWLSLAIRDLELSLKLGLKKVTDSTALAELRHLLDDDSWGAAAAAPLTINWPTK